MLFYIRFVQIEEKTYLYLSQHTVICPITHAHELKAIDWILKSPSLRLLQQKHATIVGPRKPNDFLPPREFVFLATRSDTKTKKQVFED